MTSSQRALGRAAQASAGGLGSSGIAFIDGQTYDVDLSAPLGQQARRVELPDPPPEDTDVSSETDTQERQG